ncbi:MAG: VCBS repeat-containing protein [Clostridiales bacterium]|jgi:hypothetical protein|nr:VCBS repeat-containing protein [Clostridiales bacterium]
MKYKLLMLFAVLCCFLTGCSVVGVDPQGLMQPPRATGDKQNVYDALEQVVGNNSFALKYPRTGEHRSAIIMHDITGNGAEDAIAFYQVNQEKTSGTIITFLSKEDNNWILRGSYQNTANQVDRVAFGDVDGDGADEVIVGWGNAVTGVSELSAYTYDSAASKMNEIGALDNVSKQFYNELVIADFDGDGSVEIFTANLGTAEYPANGKLLGISKDNKFEVFSSIELDRDVNQYNHISVGQVDQNTVGVLLDGTKTSSQLVTELVYWDKTNQVLKAPFDSSSTAQNVNPTIRKIPVYSENQGETNQLRFPMMELMPGYPADESDSSAYLTHWYRYDTTSGMTLRESTHYISLKDHYSLVIPQSWAGKVTAQADGNKHTVTFYEWKTANETNQTGSRGDALLKIQAVSQNEWETMKTDASLFLLMEKEDTVYLGSIPNAGNRLALTEEQVKADIAPFYQKE